MHKMNTRFFHDGVQRVFRYRTCGCRHRHRRHARAVACRLRGQLAGHAVHAGEELAGRGEHDVRIVVGRRARESHVWRKPVSVIR